MKAALALTAALAVASPAAASDVCYIMGQIAYEAGTMRQAGLTQRSAANVLGAKIGAALSDAPGSIADRQYLASLVGSAATPILRVAYSMPVYGSGFERELAAQAVAEVIYGNCVRGDL